MSCLDLSCLDLFCFVLLHSVDGWEVSLVDFSIPGAESDGSQDTVYGVSLLFQRTTDIPEEQENAVRVRLSPKPNPNVQQETKKEVEEETKEAAEENKDDNEEEEGKNDSTEEGSKNEDETDDGKPTDGTTENDEATETPKDGEETPDKTNESSGKDEPKVTPSTDKADEAKPAAATKTIQESNKFVSPLSDGPTEDVSEAGADSPTLHVSKVTPVFNQHLYSESWSTRIADFRAAESTDSPISIGIALVSSDNVIPAMRETLSTLVQDFSRYGLRRLSSQNNKAPTEGLYCQLLIELLGTFTHPEVETDALKCILEPYTKSASAPWLQPSSKSQQEVYEDTAGEDFVSSLPPVPMALLFASLLLEQKIVFSSSRRGLLLSAITSVKQLLAPLKWEHLVVPMVPEALATDLLQYPAPFILGISSQDLGHLGLLDSLPDDVTLVDLDIGRVILAPEVACDEEVVPEDSDRDALRSQLLYLAQGLGAIFGARLQPATWCTDSAVHAPRDKTSRWKKLKGICHEFVTELLGGVGSCCYMIEEKFSSTDKSERPSPETTKDLECTVLFDEDRYLQLKNARAQNRYEPLFRTLPKENLAMSLDDFDLILQCFLRGQGLSSYISSMPKENMVFS